MGAGTRESPDPERRTVWLVYVLALVCLGAFVWSNSAGHRVDAAVRTSLDEADAFFREHPYLDAPPLLARRLPPDLAQRARDSYFAERAKRSAPPIPERIQEREQRELERRVEVARTWLDTLPVQRFGLRPSAPDAVAFAAHPWLHSGWLHLLTGVALLVLLGYFLEGVWGAPVTGAAVLVASAGGAAALLAAGGSQPGAFVGTTGVAAGLLAAFLLRFRHERRDLPYGLIAATAAAVLVLPVWLGLDWAIVGAADAQAARSASLWALGGGCAGGLAFVLALRLVGVEKAPRRAEQAAGRRASNPQLERAQQERAAGRSAEAFNLLSGMVRRDPDDRDASLALWDVANDLGRPRAACQAILRVIRDELKQGERQSAVRHWCELAACGLDADAEPALLLRVAPLLRDAGEREYAVRALRNALLRASDSSASALAARVAREASELDPATAEEAAWRALGSLDLDLSERQALEALLGALQPHLPAGDGEQASAGRSPSLTEFSADDLVAPDEAPEADPERGPRPIEVDTSVRRLEAVVAVPIELGDEGLLIEAAGGSKKRVRWGRIQAVSVAAVDGLGPKTVLLVDLVLNWMSLTAEPLKVIRLRADRFDPRRLVEGSSVPLDALRAFVARLLRAADATPLPDLQSASGMPFAAFPDLASYHRDVLMVDCDQVDGYGWTGDS